MHGFILSTIDTDALVLKHQAISIYSGDKILILLDQFQTEIYQLKWMILSFLLTDIFLFETGP